MASRNPTPSKKPEEPESRRAPVLGSAQISDRIAAFAMLDAMGDATQAMKCLRLSLVGFSVADIASMLQTSSQVVYQNLYELRKKAGKTAPRKGSAKAPDDPDAPQTSG